MRLITGAARTLTVAASGRWRDRPAATTGTDACRWRPRSRRSPASSPTSSATGPTRRDRPGGHELAHVRAEAERRRAAVDGRRRLRQRPRARGADQGARRGEPAGRRRDRRARHADDRRGRVHLRLLVPRGRTASRTRTCGPTRRWRARYAEIVARRHVASATPPTPTTTRPTTPRSPRSIDELDAAMRTAFATIPRAQAAHLPRRLRLLRRGLRLEGHRRDPGRRTSRTRRRGRSPT